MKEEFNYCSLGTVRSFKRGQRRVSHGNKFSVRRSRPLSTNKARAPTLRPYWKGRLLLTAEGAILQLKGNQFSRLTAASSTRHFAPFHRRITPAHLAPLPALRSVVRASQAARESRGMHPSSLVGAAEQKRRRAEEAIHAFKPLPLDSSACLPRDLCNRGSMHTNWDAPIVGCRPSCHLTKGRIVHLI